jgi:hypothetical protein
MRPEHAEGDDGGDEGKRRMLGLDRPLLISTLVEQAASLPSDSRDRQPYL